jgi:rhodanese-related sulfurtransferase
MIVFFVTKRLAFGSKVRLNRHVDKLLELGITHVIDVRNYPSKKLRKFKTIHLNFKDNARPRPMWFYARAVRFYQNALERPNSKIYVVCRAGRRRSASMTYFLLRASGVGPRRAEATIRHARPCVQIVRAYRESGEKYLLCKKIRPTTGLAYLKPAGGLQSPALA